MSRVRLRKRPWLALGVTAIAAVLFSTLWLVRATAEYSPDPEPVPQRQPAVGSKASYTLRGMTPTDTLPDHDATPAVEGAVFLVVLFDYQSTTDDDVVCLVELLGDDRYWTNTRLVSLKGTPYHSNCEGAQGTVMSFFEIPATAVDEIRGIRIRGGGDTLVLAGEVTKG